jgi:hypothetical protein
MPPKQGIWNTYKSQSGAKRINAYDWGTETTEASRETIQSVLRKMKYASDSFTKNLQLQGGQIDPNRQLKAIKEVITSSENDDDIISVAKVLKQQRVSFNVSANNAVSFFQITGEVPIDDIDIVESSEGNFTLTAQPAGGVNPKYSGMVRHVYPREHVDPTKEIHQTDIESFKEKLEYLKLMKLVYKDEKWGQLDISSFENVDKPTQEQMDSIHSLAHEVMQEISEYAGKDDDIDDDKFGSTRGSPNPTPAPEGHKTPPKNAWSGRGQDETMHDYAKRWIKENMTEKDDYKTKFDAFVKEAGDDVESYVAFVEAHKQVYESYSPKLTIKKQTIDDKGEDVESNVSSVPSSPPPASPLIVNPTAPAAAAPILAPAAAAPVAAPAVSFAQKIENILESHASSAAHVVSPQTLKELETLEERQGHVDIELRQELGLNAASGDKPLDAYERVLKDEQPTLKQAMYGRSFNIHYKSRHTDIKKILEANKLRPKRSQHPEIQYKYHRPDWKNLLYVDPLLAWTM